MLKKFFQEFNLRFNDYSMEKEFNMVTKVDKNLIIKVLFELSSILMDLDDTIFLDFYRGDDHRPSGNPQG